MKVLLSAFILFLLNPLPGQSNSWRGITPLTSTCEDVKRILNVDSCSSPPSEYKLPDYDVMVSFADKGCGDEPRAWRVPKGTVTAIILSPRDPLPPAAFGIDLSKYKKSDREEIVGMVLYHNAEDGVTVELFNGFVLNVFLYPRKADEPLRCNPRRQPNEQTPGP